MSDDNDLNALNDELNPAHRNPHHEDTSKPDDSNGPSLYNPDGDKPEKGSSRFDKFADRVDKRMEKYGGRLGQRLRGMSKTRKMVAGAAGGAAIMGLGASMFGLFGFLNTFRLDHLMSNIEAKSFVRYQVDMNGRSSKWINAYMQLRLGEVDDPGLPADHKKNIYDDTLFRANRVDNNQPLSDWYHTMRTSKFEDDLYNKYGIKFTSVAYQDGNQVKFRPGKITIKGEGELDFNPTKKEIADIEHGNINGFNDRLRKAIDVERFGSDKEARKAIKTAVNENTQWYRVMKRLYLRKSIQNMTGVRSWKFFEETRNKASEKKISIRNKFISAALPEDTKSGRLVQCLFGIKDCKSATSDPNDPATRSSAAPAETLDCTAESTEAGCETQATDGSDDKGGKTVPNDGAAVNGVAEDAAAGISGDLIKKIVAKLNVATGVVSLVDTLNTINNSIKNHALTKLVYNARAAQAIGYFTAAMIARDQAKTGELTADEAGALTQSIADGASTSEGWDTVIDPSTMSSTVKADGYSAPKSKTKYCKTENQDAMLLPDNTAKAADTYHYLCDSEKIGSKNTAATIENGWNESIGTALKPVFAAYNDTGASKIVGVFNDALGAVLDKTLQPIINQTLKSLGLDDDVKNLAGWAIAKAASVLGAGPTVQENSPSGVMVNHIIEGGTASAEDAMRFQGAAATTSQTYTETRQSVLAYQQDQNQSTSLATRYLSLANPSSVFSTTLFNVSSVSTRTAFSSVIGSITRLPGTLLNLPVHADDDNQTGYEAANFAGVNTYDYPKQCLDTDPLDMTPENSTNADDLGLISAGDLTWDLLKSNDDFYGKLYKDHPDDGDKINQVYDCAILDNTVSGALGAAYGVDPGPNALQTGSGDSDTTGAEKFTVASYNMCQEKNHPGSCPDQDNKVEDISNNILGTGKLGNDPVDLIGAQEFSQETQTGIMGKLSGYTSFPDTVAANNGLAVIWSSRFTQKASGYIGQVYTNSGIFVDGSPVPNNSHPPGMPWVALTDSQNGQTYYVVSNHSPTDGYGNTNERITNARAIAAWASTKTDGIVIVMGDFNKSGPVDDGQKSAYCYLTGSGPLQHVYDLQVDGPNSGSSCPSDASKIPIDQIYVSKGSDLKASGWKRFGGDTAGSGTDHSPAFVTLIPPDSGSAASVPYKNPVYDDDVPDPSAIKGDDGTYHVYATGRGLQHLTSKDLVHWKRVDTSKSPVLKGAPAAATGNTWAPDVFKSGSNYIMTWGGSSGGLNFSLYYAVGTSADGPFTFKGALVNGSSSGNLAIDSNIFMSDQGPILYYGSGSGGIKAVKLKIADDGTVQLSGDKKTILTPDPTSEWIAEGAYMQKQGSYYYLYYSIGRFDYASGYADKPAYAVHVARSTDPMGPFEKDPTPVLHGDNTTVSRPGGNSVILDNAGKPWMVYHAYIGSDHSNRKLMIDPITYQADGWPIVNSGVPSLTTISAGPATGASTGSSSGTTTPSSPGQGFVGNDGFGGGSCVDYVKYILSRHSSKYDGASLGNGKDVAGSLAKYGYTVDNTPAVHAVVSFPGPPYGKIRDTYYGHVAIVAQVNSDGSIVVEESNFSTPGHYGTHPVKAAQAATLTYAHTEVGWH